MFWRGPLASAVLGVSLVALGCDSDENRFICRTDPGLLHAIVAAGGEGPEGVCAQAPENDKPIVQTTLQKPTVEPTVGVTAARVRAVVNGEAILDEELQAMTFQAIRSLAAVPEPERTKRQTEILNQALDTLIEREVVMQDMKRMLDHPGNEQNKAKMTEYAEKEFEKTWLRPIKAQLKIKSDEDFKAFLKTQGLSFEMQKRLWMRNFMSQQYLQQRIYPITDNIGHPDIVAYYEKHPEQFKIDDEIQWQELFIAAAKYPNLDAAKRLAEQIAQRLRQGEDLVELSKQFDDGDSRYRKGEGIGRKRGEIKPPEVEATLFNLKDGDIALLEQPTGVRVIRLVKRQYAGQMPFDEKTQKLIKDKIRGEIMEREIKLLVLEMKRNAVYEIYK